jgi:hypothetical protein
MTKDEALKLALSTLNEVRQETFRLMRDGQTLYAEDNVWSTIISIKEALAQPEQEPVAWGVFDHNLHDMFFAKEEAHEMVRLKGDESTVKPLYTTPPPQRKPLTDEQINAFFEGMEPNNGFWKSFAKAIEAAHGIKE